MKICILGCGSMGAAIADGLRKIHGNKIDFVVWDTNADAMQNLPYAEEKHPEHWLNDDNEPDVIILAVKPQALKDALYSCNFQACKNPLKSKTIWVSIVAGTNIEKLENLLPTGAKIARVMPNTPALIGEGCSFYTLNNRCVDGDDRKVEFIFNSVGITNRIAESQMDAATGLSGSGPAFVYSFIEALAEAGVIEGLSYEIALKAAAKTVFGSAKMVLETGEMPEVLKARVMSAGGTTVAGIMALEAGGMRNAVMSAVISATKRSKELGEI